MDSDSKKRHIISAAAAVVAIAMILAYVFRERDVSYYCDIPFGDLKEEPAAIRETLEKVFREALSDPQSDRTPSWALAHPGPSVKMPELAALTPEQKELFFDELDRQIRRAPRREVPALVSRKIHLGFLLDPRVTVRECQKILAEDPDNFFALNHCASGYMLLGEWRKALEYAARAIQVDGESSYMHNLVAQIYFRKGDLDRALDHFRQALEMTDGDDMALYGIELVRQTRAVRR